MINATGIFVNGWITDDNDGGITIRISTTDIQRPIEIHLAPNVAQRLSDVILRNLEKLRAGSVK